MATAMLLASAFGVSAATINVVGKSRDNGSNVISSFADDFGAYMPDGASWTGTGPRVMTGSDKLNRSPFRFTEMDGTEYFAVGKKKKAWTSAYLSLGSELTSIDLLWGSIDRTNRVEFYSEGEVVASYTGAQIAKMLGLKKGKKGKFGAMLSFDVGQEFDGINFLSKQASFEFALASLQDEGPPGEEVDPREELPAVPLPAGGALLLTGIAGLSLLRRRKRA